jgi:glutamate dehydrogenase
MITLTGINETEFINPYISKLQEEIRNKGGEGLPLKLALAHGLFRKATSNYIDETPFDTQIAIVEKAEQTLLDFLKSGEETSISSMYLPGDKNHSGYFTVLKDRPFIVDTIREYFNAYNIGLVAFFHPILKLEDGTNLSLCYTEFEIPPSLKSSTISNELNARLKQLKAVTNDFKKILDFIEEQILLTNHAEGSKTLEIKDLLQWIYDGTFIFLGISEWNISKNIIIKELGILNDKSSKFKDNVISFLNEDLNTLLENKLSYFFSKIPLRSPIHRPNFIDLITIKINENTAISIPGLFTSKTNIQPASTIPLLKNKLTEVLLEEGLIPNSHDYKELISIADTLPKSDFFQYSDDEIKKYFKQVTKTQLRGKATLIHLIDQSKRFHYLTSILPKERYSSETVQTVEEILCKSFSLKHDTRNYESFSMLGDYPIVLIRSLIPLSKEVSLHKSIEEIEDEVENTTASWDEKLRSFLRNQHNETTAIKLYSYYSKALDDSYKATHSPEETICDIEMLERLTSQFPLELSLEEHPTFDQKKLYRLRLYKRGESLTLSGIVPFMENAGFEIISETVASVATEGAVWAAIYDLFITPRLIPSIDEKIASQILLPALKKILQKEIDNDYLNHLLINPGLSAFEISILRGLVRYLVQIKLAPSPRGAMESLVYNPEIAKFFVDFFFAKFKPASPDDCGPATKERIDSLTEIDENISDALKKVPQLSHDRSLRAMWNILHCMVRTNYFCHSEPSSISFKIDSQRVLSIPEPKPFKEIFVSAPDFQGVHLRGGKVSRGGLRWSSRKDDFRTEVLGLMKTQMVKNSIIVPVGAKGGFVLHQEPETRPELFQAIESTYKKFIRSLLEITDNRKDATIITPKNVIYYDDEDSYLVVAADRGTATFSDLANTIAVDEFSFWLGDAFASGGSAGYDHKILGITAKGAWECALRHFKEIDIDPTTQEFTVAGIGDMSGDVFGNGLLCSNKAKLIAAFDHRHIFIDPNPDPARSFEERKRLFSLSRSSWDDYDRSQLSHGSCIVSRNEKEIHISPEAQKALGTNKEVFSSNELIQTILKAPVDLLWNGGIGTYVKAISETHLDVSDKDNDDLRVNGRDLRARIVAEGGNLGFTQLGRIEYTRVGGHINTDAVDNSGGVDMSDLEVNLKLLFQKSVLDNSMDIEKRNAILKSCEDEACEKILSRNRSQSRILSLSVKRSRVNLNFYQELINLFQKQGRLSVSGEFLPDDEIFEKRRISKAGLTRPELAIIMAHTKMAIYETMLDSDLPDDPFLIKYLHAYFPKSITEPFKDLISEHTLRREIIATQVANLLVERMGGSFVYRLSIELGASPIDVVRSFIISDTIFSGSELVRNLAVLDKANTSRFYVSALLRVQAAIEAIARWFISEYPQQMPLDTIIDSHQIPFQNLLQKTEDILSTNEITRYHETVRELLMHAVPKDLAKSIGAVQYATVYLDIIRVADQVKKKPTEIAKLYAHLGSELQIGQLIESANNLHSENKWEDLAGRALSTQFRKSIARLCERIIIEHQATDMEVIARYFTKRKDLLTQYESSMNQILKESPTISSLYIVSNMLQSIAEPGQRG